MPQGRRNAPNPVVRVSPPMGWTDQQLEEARKGYQKYQKGYVGNHAPVLLSDADIRLHSKKLVKRAFRLLQLEPEDFMDCFNACVDKCVDSGVLPATVWSKWGGYKACKEKLEKVRDLTEAHGNYHIIDAPTVVCAIIVRKFRLLEPDKNDSAADCIVKYRVFDFAHASVMNWKPNDHRIKPTDQIYKAVQPRPTTVSDSDTSTVSDDDVAVDMTVRNVAGLMERCQQFQAIWAKPREPTPPPVIVQHIPRKLDRMEAEQYIAPLLHKILTEKWNSVTNSQLQHKLADKLVAVLSKETRAKIKTWATQAGFEDTLQLLEKHKDNDLMLVTWDEVRELPGIPEWSSKPVDVLIDELLKLVEDKTIKGHLAIHVEGIAYGIRDYIDQIEKKHQQWAEAKAFQQAQEMIAQGIQDGLAIMEEENQRKIDKGIADGIEAWKKDNERKRKRELEEDME
ncbi:hypothetical protein V8C26DRAFT_432309 [Trichoderma gracile]